MKAVFLAMNLLYGIPGLLLGVAAASNVTQNPVAGVLGVTIGGLAAVCLWLAKETLVNGSNSSADVA
ncbi:MAG: hypothetical protein IPI44_09965 [Sulfuritalea sp.]|nr:hypothetical protein [Sulfuritalea sp.]